MVQWALVAMAVSASVIVPMAVPVEIPVTIAMKVPMVAVPIPMARIMPVVVTGVMPMAVLRSVDVNAHAGMAVIPMAMAMTAVMGLRCFSRFSADESGTAEDYCGYCERGERSLLASKAVGAE